MSDAPRIGLGEGDGHDWHYPVPVVIRKGLDPKMPKVGHRALITVPLDDDGRHVGQISMLAGCAVQVVIESPDGSARSVYYFNPAELFEAVQLAHVAGQPGFELPPVAAPVPEPPKVADAVVPDGSVEYRIVAVNPLGEVVTIYPSSIDLGLQRCRFDQLKKIGGGGFRGLRIQVRHVGPWVDHEEPMVADPKGGTDG